MNDNALTNVSIRSKILNFVLSPLGAVTLLVCGILCVYAQTFWFGFVWDDHHFIKGNPSLTSWRYILRWFYDGDCYQSTGTFWRPVRNFSFLADWYVAGKQQSAALMHVHNVLMHIVNALVLLWVLRLMVRVYVRPNLTNTPDAFGVRQLDDVKWLVGTLIAAFIWAVHPLNTETVAWIKCRDEQLFTLFYLWGMGLFLGALSRPGGFTAQRIAAVVLMGVLSVLSKEMALTYPLILGLLWVLTCKRGSGWSLPPKPVMLIGFCTCSTMVLYVVVRHFVLGQTEQIARISGSFYVDMLTMVRAVARYVELSFIPARQLADYNGYPLSTSPWNLPWMGAALMLIVATGLGIVYGLKNRLVLFAWFGFLLSLIPVSNLVSTMQYLAERFLYLPLCFLVLVAVVVGVKFVEYLWNADASRRRVFIGLFLLFLLALTGAANLRAAIWKNQLLLFRTTWRDGYNSQRVFFNSMNMLMYYGLFDEAYSAAYSLINTPNSNEYFSREDLGLINQTLGRCMLYQSRVDEGLSYTLTALEYIPDYFEARVNLGVCIGMKGETTQALEMFDKLLEEKPEHLNLLSNKALMLKRLGDNAGARRLWMQVLDIDSENRAATDGLIKLDEEEAASGTATIQQ